jgi:hypothetical protein
MHHPHPDFLLALNDIRQSHSPWIQRDMPVRLQPVQDDCPRWRGRAMARNGKVEALPRGRLRDVCHATGRGYGG